MMNSLPVRRKPNNKRDFRLQKTRDGTPKLVRLYERLGNRYEQTNIKQGGLGGIIPARLDTQQAAMILGFQEHDIPVLVSDGHLEPLGKPMQNMRKYFARVQIMELAESPSWLAKATKSIYQHWQCKNAGRAKGVAAKTTGGLV